MNEFNSKYNKIKLSQMFDCDDLNETHDTDQIDNNDDINNHQYQQIEYELERIKISSNQFQRRLKDIEHFKKIKKNNNSKEYESWDINTIISWIRGLENQRFDKYSDKLRHGFQRANVKNGNNLVYITQSFLNSDPFNIENIKDCQDLAEYFHGLNQTKHEYHTEGMKYSLS